MSWSNGDARLKCMTGYADQWRSWSIKMTDYTHRQKQKLVAIVIQPMKVCVSLIGTISPLYPLLFRFFFLIFSHILSSRSSKNNSIVFSLWLSFLSYKKYLNKEKCYSPSPMIFLNIIPLILVNNNPLILIPNPVKMKNGGVWYGWQIFRMIFKKIIGDGIMKNSIFY